MNEDATKFDRMVRVRPSVYGQASVVSALEGKQLRKWVEEAITEKLNKSQFSTVVEALTVARADGVAQ